MGTTKKSKNQKIIKKQVNKAIKRIPLGIVICILIVGCIAGYLYYKKINDNKDSTNENNIKGNVAYLVQEGTTVDDVKITFLELFGTNGNPQIGDSVFIECGDIDILIDAGEKASGSNTVVPFIEEHVSDNILELVIVTHADSDHLGGMVGLSNSYGALEVPGITYQYIVDFGYEGQTQLYKDYLEVRNKKIKEGTKYFSIGSIFDSDHLEAITRFYLGVDTYLDLLDYKTYEISEITDDNDRSVSCLLTHNDKKVLLCGDAEKKEEAYLTSLNIGHVDVFKANHHGSPTSNTNAFLDNITPNYVIICSSEENKYNLPKKTIIERFNNYTENVFATFISGNIMITLKDNDVIVTAEKSLVFVQKSDWYLTDDPDNPR
ncbi:beta-lactamase-like protein [Staphylococcus sp. CAG:324]|nr:beta-lactamase-like protein [Staphylococcus sp. CAG:324]